MVVIKEVKTKKDLKKFVKFPLKLYRNNPAFVPVLISDEINEFTKETNDAFSYCESRQFLAYRDGKIVGRVAGILNHQYNQKCNVNQMRFTRLDAIDDPEVFKALFDTIVEYAKEKGNNEVIGPIGFCDLDKQGLLIEGFDQISMYITPYNEAYYPKHYEEYGFQKAVDWVEYKITMPEEPDPKLEKISNFVQKRYGYKVIELKDVKQVMGLVKDGLHIMNEVYSHLYGYVALTDLQIEQFSKTLEPLINIDFVCAVANRDDELIAYGFVAPSVGKAFQKGHGHLFPLTIFRLMKALKHNDTIDLYSVGVRHQYQNTGANAIILNEIMKACHKHGIKYAETGPELVTNTQVQAQWKDYEKTIHKRRRCYSKFI